MVNKMVYVIDRDGIHYSRALFTHKTEQDGISSNLRVTLQVVSIHLKNSRV